MMGGVVIDGSLVQPEEVSSLEESVRLRVVVAEGKKHEVSSHTQGGQRGTVGRGAGRVGWWMD
jgi:16S rRNA U516 pseudouridylate synthase RsuA-like enzyme